MELSEKKISSEEIFKGKVISLYKDTVLLPNGNEATRELVKHNGGVCIVALTENEEVYVVEQFRYPFNKVILEIPAGKIDVNEDPLVCGKRELEEETGLIAQHYENLGDFYPTVGYTSEIIYTYMATNLSLAKQNLDEDEFLNVKKIPLKDLYTMVMNGEIQDGKTQTAILKTWCKLHSK